MAMMNFMRHTDGRTQRVDDATLATMGPGWIVVGRQDGSAPAPNLIPPDRANRPSPEALSDGLRKQGYAVYPHDHHLG